jgi:BlaI family transcriptional regulator, penicillinase repressor
MSSPGKNTNSFQEPTRSELEILQVLWRYGPSTTRFVNDQLNKERKVIYMSTLKLMQIMFEKGMLEKDDSQHKHIYKAKVEEGITKGALLGRVVDKVFNGSAAGLMLQLLGNSHLSKEEIEEFRELIDKMDKKD